MQKIIPLLLPLFLLTGCYAYYPAPYYNNVAPAAQAPAPTNQYCREFNQLVTIDGHEQEAVGTACRQPDGTWKTVSQ